MSSTERPLLNWKRPPEWDRFQSSVEQTHGATRKYAGFEIEQAWREYNEVHPAEKHVDQLLKAVGCRGQDIREKTPPTRDVSDGGERVSVRIQKDVKEGMSEYANETGQENYEVLRAVVCWYLDGGRIGIITDKLEVAVPDVESQLAELDSGDNRERTAEEKKRQWLADKLTPGEFTHAVFGEKLEAMPWRGGDTEYMRERYLQPVLDRIDYTEHPNNTDLFVPEEQARKYAEEQGLDPNAPAFERKPYGDLTDTERIHKLRVELVLQAARHDGKHALRVGKVRSEVFDETPGTRKVKDLMDRAADGAPGFETDVKDGKRIRCDLEAVKDRDVLTDADLTAETDSTPEVDVDETDDDDSDILRPTGMEE